VVEEGREGGREDWREGSGRVGWKEDGRERAIYTYIYICIVRPNHVCIYRVLSPFLPPSIQPTYPLPYICIV